MNYYKKIAKIILFCFPVLFAAGCSSDGECVTTSAVSLGADFYYMKFDFEQDQFVSFPLLTDTFTIYGLGNDSLLIDNQNIYNVRLPLKPFDTQTTYIFQRENMLPDTINFVYDNENNFISLECGCLVFHRITDIEYTFNSIDSVVVMNNFAADEQAKNIRIYFKKEQ